ncbi:MAG: hypothetical protein JWM76_2668 [Pseudonocardiales bacterium]|nr:hypothetical protein [Pseudonocardiales bacterium]
MTVTEQFAPHGLRSLTADALRPGDRLLSLAGVAYPQQFDDDAEPTLVCRSRPVFDSPYQQEPVAEVITSHGTIYTDPESPAVAIRDVVITARTVLLISRRMSLHAELLGLGVPLIRRTPLADSGFVRAVDAEDWFSAPLVVLDGNLPTGALDALRNRSDLAPRDGMLMVGDDPDDYRLEGRARIARTSTVAVLPWDRDALKTTFQQATGRATSGGASLFDAQTLLNAPNSEL